MVYNTASQKILIYLFILTLVVTIISGPAYWMMWSILPISFFLLWLAGMNSYCHIMRTLLISHANNVYVFASCRCDVHGRESL